ncbi:hypothetical protein [Candidatus Nitrospira bockiana]
MSRMASRARPRLVVRLALVDSAAAGRLERAGPAAHHEVPAPAFPYSFLRCGGVERDEH